MTRMASEEATANLTMGQKINARSGLLRDVWKRFVAQFVDTVDESDAQGPFVVLFDVFNLHGPS